MKSKTLHDLDYEILEMEQGLSRTNGLVASMGLSLFSLAILAIILLLAVPGCNHTAEAAQPFTDEQAILAIIGEAEDQGADGMLAVACAIRNRGTLKGVYGIKAPRVKQKLYSKKTYQRAARAWALSADCADVTKGATHWENIKAFGKPYWSKEMVVAYACKDHVFYKKKKGAS